MLEPTAEQWEAARLIADHETNAMIKAANAASRVGVEKIEISTQGALAIAHMLHLMNSALAEIIGEGWFERVARVKGVAKEQS